MFYLQYSYEQISIINKLVREIKSVTGHDIKLSDDAHMEKLDALMPEIQDETINKLYAVLKKSLEVEQKQYKPKKPRRESKSQEKMYRGSALPVDDTEPEKATIPVAEATDEKTATPEDESEKKRKRRIYRGQIMDE